MKQELVEILKAPNLEVVGVTKKNVISAPPELKEKIEKVNKEIYEKIDRMTKHFMNLVKPWCRKCFWCHLFV